MKSKRINDTHLINYSILLFLYELEFRNNDKHEYDLDLKNKTDETEEQEKDHKIFCAVCGNYLTKKEFKIQINGQHQHTFTNPQGIIYHIRCFKSVPGCTSYGYPTKEYTWFAGYAWEIIICNKCSIHLGWKYDSGESCFFGLINDRIVEK